MEEETKQFAIVSFALAAAIAVVALTIGDCQKHAWDTNRDGRAKFYISVTYDGPVGAAPDTLILKPK